jgi:DNA-binding LytR/AlgR family response regulator
VKPSAAPPLRTLIVDDEPIARKILRDELQSIPEVVVVGEAENGLLALQRISELHPDLVLLDVQMPVMDGFEVLAMLGGASTPAVVMVTAFDQHAVRAFEAGAIDYLLKPVKEKHLRRALRRAMEVSQQPGRAEESGANGAMRKVVGRAGEEYCLLDLDDVLAFQAEGELVWIVTSGQRLLATQTLREIELRLRGEQFRRIHRNAVVNVNHVRKLSAMTSQRWLITLSNSSQVVASKRQARRIREILHW